MATRDVRAKSLLNNLRFDFRYKRCLESVSELLTLHRLLFLYGLITWLLEFPLYDGLCANVCQKSPSKKVFLGQAVL